MLLGQIPGGVPFSQRKLIFFELMPCALEAQTVIKRVFD